MKYLSLFSGIGGFELGIQKAYVEATNRKKNRRSKETSKTGNSKRHQKFESADAKRRQSSEYHNGMRGRQESFTCVGYSEIDKYAIEIYKKHFPTHKNYGDIIKIKEKELPDFDFLCGGFPCQSFSIAGKRKGFHDTRGTMFFEICRILKQKQPRLLLLENVKGLLSHDEGRTFATIIRSLDELGYNVQWQVLNSKNFGVPQNRERVFIVGSLRKVSRPEIFPFTENNSEDIVLPTITTRVTADSNGTYVGKRSPRQIIGGSQGNRVYDPKGISTTLASQAGGLGAKTGLYAVGGLQKHQVPRKDGNSPTLTQAMGKGGGQTPIVWSKDIKIRRLTPKECERLQGFPDNWTTGVSDTQRYKTLGNAVTVNVVSAIAKRLLIKNNK
ncbi:MAG: DNA (cytosine-5-)-methyltransferase [Candidatus Nomurabacteria bacterium]|nr:DNA (cytosine-5-)-methyltransferase [Candidatus Nomurabacteria bacterium]MCX6788463.1 DNA (cytosine-5-)-methyltransferase [Candidatus Jorgensenbacteria bacterium]